jgi:hypothetical protein
MSLQTDAQVTICVMDDHWTPELALHERGGSCRLSLGCRAQGEGRTLQEAADDLVARLLTLALCLRSGSGLAVSADGPALDLRWLSFLHELGELAASGSDIRERLFAPGNARRAP